MQLEVKRVMGKRREWNGTPLVQSRLSKAVQQPANPLPCHPLIVGDQVAGRVDGELLNPSPSAIDEDPVEGDNCSPTGD